VYVIAPPSEKALLPDNVLKSPIRVTCNDLCEIPVKILGRSKLEGKVLNINGNKKRY